MRMNLPPVTRSLRFRLSGMTTAVSFGLAGLALAGIYAVVLRAIQSITMTELVAGEPVVVGGERILIPLTQREVRSIESLFKEAVLNQMALWVAVILLGLFVLSLVVSWIVANRSLRPLDEITMVAREIQATDLDRRIGLEGPDDELTRMASTFDAMLDRLAGSFESQKRFLAQTSHDLRTPLSVIRSNLEVVADDPDATVEDWRETGEIVVRAAERMATMVDDLLAAARLELGGSALEETDLRQLVEGLAEELDVTAGGQSVTLVVDATDVGIVAVDPVRITRAMNNLIDNALRVSPPGSAVRIATRSEGSWIDVGVLDRGPGIDPIRVRDGDVGDGGFGLGIVRQVAAMHGGHLTAVRRPDGGSLVSIALPVTADPADPPIGDDGLLALYG